MSILIDTERRRYTPSGLQFFCDNLLRGLSELGASDITIYGPSEAYGFPLERFSALHKLINPTPKKYDLLHITHQNQSYFPTKYQEKRILTVHDLNYLHIAESDPVTRKKFVKQVAQNIDDASLIVCISDFTRRDLESREELFPALKDKRIEVVYNGLDTTPRISPEESETLLPVEFAGKDFLLNIGVANPKKNQQALVETMPLIDDDVVLVVDDVNSPYARHLKSRAEAIGATHRLHLFEHITEDEKHALLASCRALVFPSLIEGFGYPPVEAMVYGKPVILSRNGSLPEVGGDVALYLSEPTPWEIEKAVKKLEQHPCDPERIKEWVSGFSYQKMAENYLALYNSLS